MAVIPVMTAIGAWAVTTGQISYVVTHGVSMNPVYHRGDLVFVIRSDSYQPGQIAAYHGSSPGLKVLHRIIGGNATDGYILKGDHNRSVDTFRPTGDRMIGTAALLVPKGGVWLSPVLSPTGLGMLGFLVAGGGATAVRTRRQIPRGRRKKRVKAMSRQGSPWAMVAAVLAALGRLRPALRATAIAAAGLTVLAAAAAVLGWMKPVLTTVGGHTETGPTLSFSYSANVGRTPAYDTTVIRSPEPVFRRVVRVLDVQMQYLGHPGTIDTFLKLTTESGWHTTTTLTSPQRFTTESHRVAARLDLDTLAARAASAATAIGVEPGPVTIVLTARVTAAGKPSFTAPLAFTMTPVQLLLEGGAASLKVNKPIVTPSRLAPRTIDFFGHPVMTAARARSMAVFFLLTALAAAVVVFARARHELPARTRADIERRFPQLLVHVEPMASPPGKPVVNVDSFPALVKLAERYGQMILTWRRPEADDFVVRDEGITYRYRISLDEPVLQNIEHLNRPAGMRSHRRKATQEVS